MLKLYSDIIAKNPKYIKPVSQLSLDSSSGVVLCNDSFNSFDIEEFIEKTKASGTHGPCVPDMLHIQDGKAYIVEFKNADIGSKCKKDLRDNVKLKGIEGFYLYCHDYMQKNGVVVSFKDLLDIELHYILVVSETKCLQSCSASNQVHLYLSSVIERMNLGYYKNRFFKSVQILTEKQFTNIVIPCLKVM